MKFQPDEPNLVLLEYARSAQDEGNRIMEPEGALEDGVLLLFLVTGNNTVVL